MTNPQIAYHFGWALPAHEQHLQQWMGHPKNKGFVLNGRQAYQGVKQVTAMKFVRNHRVAIDVGGHVGFHSFNLAPLFREVHAFEPVALHRECFAINVTAPNVRLHPVALGVEPGEIAMKTEVGSSGNTCVDTKAPGDTPMITLDSLGLQDVDYAKLDCEGFEENVLRGAEDTLRRCKPVVMVEQKRQMAAGFGLPTKGAIAFLQSLGYQVVAELSGDYIMVHP